MDMLPQLSDLGRRLTPEGKEAYCWSSDVFRAYQQLRADPASAPLFCIIVDGHLYVDIALPFYLRTSSVTIRNLLDPRPPGVLPATSLQCALTS